MILLLRPWGSTYVSASDRAYYRGIQARQRAHEELLGLIRKLPRERATFTTVDDRGNIVSGSGTRRTLPSGTSIVGTVDDVMRYFCGPFFAEDPIDGLRKFKEDLAKTKKR